jgi:hypothetical protein
MAGSRSIGTLTVDLVARIGGFTQGMDKAEKALDKKSRDLSRKAKQLGTDLGLALSAGIGATAAVMGTYIRNTIEAEKVQAQLAARIKSTGGAAGLALKDLNAMADALQNATTFDDEAIGGAQSMLLTFTKIGKDVFPRATEAVLDMATAMGSDLNSAALQVGKALNDPVLGVSALSRVGVQFTKDQKEVIAKLVETGKTAEAQAIILRELETQMGGSARAARDTLGGALEGLKNSFDNLLEGDTGSDGMKGAVSAVNALNKSLNDPQLKQGIDTIAEGLLSAANAAVQAVAKMGDFFGKYHKFLADQGFIAGDEIDQLEERRDKLVEFKGTLRGKLLFNSSDIDKEITEVDNRIEQLKHDAVWGNVLGGSASSYDAKPSSGGGSPTKANAKAGKSDAQRQAEGAAKAAREAMEAQNQWHQSVLDMTATLAGPAAEVQREYEKNISQLNADFNDGKVALADYAKAEELYAEQRDKALEAIKATRTPAQQMLEDLQFEAELLGKTREEQELLTAARYLGAEAATEQGKAVLAAMKELQTHSKEIADQVELMDGARAATRTFFDSLKDGEGILDSLKDAFDRFEDALFDWATNGVIEQLFGKQGTTGQGSTGGGWLSDLLGAFTGSSTGSGNAGFWASLFGGGRASGGPVSAGKLYEVGEYNRPELLMAGGKQYMIPGNAGAVMPMHGRDQGFVQNITNNFSEKVDRRTRSQIESAMWRAGYQASRRLGG